MSPNATAQSQDSEAPTESNNSSLSTPSAIITQYLLERSPSFRELSKWRERGWANPQGDVHFANQRSRADNASKSDRQRFYTMMCEIGDELQTDTKALTPASPSSEPIRILDLCMAPGGYTASALKYNPSASACGISLPISKGGHELLLPPALRQKTTVEFADITMYASAFGVDSIPSTHPHASDFLTHHPFFSHDSSHPKFSLVFCDGQVLRTHPRPEYRQQQQLEATRLTISQLLLAMQRIEEGGTLIMLLHKVENWNTLQLLYQLSSLADNVRLWKSRRKHRDRSSFYVVAEGVRTGGREGEAVVGRWRGFWWRATFGGVEGTGEGEEEVDLRDVRRVLEGFGDRLVQLAEGVWDIQARALSKAPYMKG